MLVPARQVGTHRTAGPVLQKEPTDGGVSGGVGRSQWWPSGCHGFGSGSRSDSVHIHSRGPASLHPVLGSSLGTDIISEFGPNLKNLRLDARPCSAGRHARTAGPILQKEPPDGGVSGGVGRSKWWPSGCDGFGSGSRGDSVHIHSQGPASLHPVLGSSLGTDIIFELGPNLKSLRFDARPCSPGRHASPPHCESLGMYLASVYFLAPTSSSLGGIGLDFDC